VVDGATPVRIGSLFSGYGGLELGVQAALGGTVAWHVENEPAAAAVLTAHWPQVPNYGDITAVDWTQIQPVDVVCGGFPCQPVSHAGKRLGDRDERWLWDEFARCIRVLRPRLVVVENVRGLFTAGNGRLFGQVLGDLADLGMDARWQGLRAADVGAPHGRYRVFIVAYPADAERVGRGGWAHQPVGGSAGGVTAAGGGADAAADAEPVDGRAWRAASRSTENAHRQLAGRDHSAAADPDERGGQRLEEPAGVEGAPRSEPDRRGALREQQHPAHPDWGPYSAAIARWEHTIGRAAPAPTEPGRTGAARLSPRFVEWMMGLPAGWVTGVPISRNAQLKALGNGVVPQQAAAAVRALLGGSAAPSGVSGRLLPTPDTMNYRDGSSLRAENNAADGGSHAVSLHHWAYLRAQGVDVPQTVGLW